MEETIDENLNLSRILSVKTPDLPPPPTFHNDSFLISNSIHKSAQNSIHKNMGSHNVLSDDIPTAAELSYNNDLKNRNVVYNTEIGKSKSMMLERPVVRKLTRKPKAVDNGIGNNNANRILPSDITNIINDPISNLDNSNNNNNNGRYIRKTSRVLNIDNYTNNSRSKNSNDNDNNNNNNNDNPNITIYKDANDVNNNSTYKTPYKTPYKMSLANYQNYNYNNNNNTRLDPVISRANNYTVNRPTPLRNSLGRKDLSLDSPDSDSNLSLPYLDANDNNIINNKKSEFFRSINLAGNNKHINTPQMPGNFNSMNINFNKKLEEINKSIYERTKNLSQRMEELANMNNKNSMDMDIDTNLISSSINQNNVNGDDNNIKNYSSTVPLINNQNTRSDVFEPIYELSALSKMFTEKGLLPISNDIIKSSINGNLLNNNEVKQLVESFGKLVNKLEVEKNQLNDSLNVEKNLRLNIENRCQLLQNDFLKESIAIQNTLKDSIEHSRDLNRDLLLSKEEIIRLQHDNEILEKELKVAEDKYTSTVEIVLNKFGYNQVNPLNFPNNNNTNESSTRNESDNGDIKRLLKEIRETISNKNKEETESKLDAEVIKIPKQDLVKKERRREFNTNSIKNLNKLTKSQLIYLLQELCIRFDVYNIKKIPSILRTIEFVIRLLPETQKILESVIFDDNGNKN